jgi:hypothetical protein
MGFTFPTGATITGIDVLADAWSTDATGCQLGVSLSWNGGATWTTTGTNPTKTANLTGIKQTFTLGGSTDLWGRSSWSTSELANGNFRLRVHDMDPGNNCDNNAATRLDFIRARVYYSYSSENSDDDHFFIAPTAAGMADVFATVAKLACPALTPPAAPTPPAPPDPPPLPENISIGSWQEIISP